MRKYSYKKGFLSKITNPRGTRNSVYIAETKEGYTARYTKSGRKIGFVKKDPEKYAYRLSKFHKRVSIRD